MENRDLREYTAKIGRAGLHTLFPNDFEYYAVTLELTDSKGQTLEHLTFPVSPDSISYDDQSLANTKKTLGGISSTDSDTIRPKKISMSGTFGRKLRLLTGINNQDATGTSSGNFKGEKPGFQINTKVFKIRLKTGYGTTKILKAIVDRSRGIDKYNEPNNLYLYFPVMGEDYLIKVDLFRMNQDVTSSNMLWKYTLNVTVLGNLKEIKTANSSSIVGNDLVQRGLGLVANEIKKLI